MRKVYQTVVDNVRGNCMQAAIASILDLELSQVPNIILFDHDNGQWFRVLVWFFDIMGWKHKGYYHFHYDGEDPDLSQCEEYSIDGLFYASVKSKKYPEGTHAVVIDSNGVVVHDPNPVAEYSQEGDNVIENQRLLYVYAFTKKS